MDKKHLCSKTLPEEDSLLETEYSRESKWFLTDWKQTLQENRKFALKYWRDFMVLRESSKEIVLYGKSVKYIERLYSS